MTGSSGKTSAETSTTPIRWLNGELPKWLKGLVSKTSRRFTACKGSNPFSSAKLYSFVYKKRNPAGFLL